MAPSSAQLAWNQRALQTPEVWTSGAERLPATQGAKPRRIVLIVFDEWDYTRVFDGTAVRPEFPQLARVAAAGIVFTSASAPGTATLESLPSILTGRRGAYRTRWGYVV
jgi:glucan phosphoethanolaminetransferase (alkaline phosphatase superfamily)